MSTVSTEPDQAGPTDGPSIETLVRRLIDTPTDFLASPQVGGRAGIDVAAVVSDLFVRYGTAGLDTERAAPFRPTNTESHNWLRTVLVTSWLLTDPSLLALPMVDGAWRLLTADLLEMATIVGADELVADPDRREELARRTLASLGLTPAGETAAQAADRLSTLDSAERQRVVAATRAAEERAAEVRAAMHAKAAAEAAAKASRE